jgi:hypothetical protein
MLTSRSVISLLAIAALLVGIVHAGTRPEDLKWLASKEAEKGVVKTESGLLYKGAYIVQCLMMC